MLTTCSLQENTIVHWTTWLGANMVLGTLGFIIAEAVPILNYLLGLAGSLCYAPFSLIFPALLWMYDFKSYRSDAAQKRFIYAFHILIVLVGLVSILLGITLPLRHTLILYPTLLVHGCGWNVRASRYHKQELNPVLTTRIDTV